MTIILTPLPFFLPSFGRRDLGTRCSLNAGIASNDPHFNPGPGLYQPSSGYKGGKTAAGADSPKYVFGHSQKLISPEARLSATVFISNVSLKSSTGTWGYQHLNRTFV